MNGDPNKVARAEQRLAAAEAGHRAARMRGSAAMYPGGLGAELEGLWLHANRLAKSDVAALYYLLRQLRLAAARARGSHTEQQWQELCGLHGHRCVICGCKPASLHKDHKVAISKGGSDAIENIQPSCKRCNSIKGHRDGVTLQSTRTCVELAGAGLRPLDVWPLRRKKVIARPELRSRCKVPDEKLPHLCYRRGVPYLRFRFGGREIVRTLGHCSKSRARQRAGAVMGILRGLLPALERKGETKALDALIDRLLLVA